jgi:hypothetical protein
MDLSHVDSGLSSTSGPSRALPDCPFKDCLGQTSTSEAFAYTSQPLKEEPGKRPARRASISVKTNYGALYQRCQMARQKNKKKQGRKQQNKRRENKARIAGLGDTMNLVGAWVAFHHPAFTVTVAFIIWVIACWERNRSNG